MKYLDMVYTIFEGYLNVLDTNVHCQLCNAGRTIKKKYVSEESLRSLYAVEAYVC